MKHLAKKNIRDSARRKRLFCEDVSATVGVEVLRSSVHTKDLFWKYYSPMVVREAWSTPAREDMRRSEMRIFPELPDRTVR